MGFKGFLGAIITVILMVFHVDCIANPKGTVNILTWYAYLRSPEIISAVKDQCGVEIFYDEYYSVSECLSRITTIRDFYYYDIVIFPSDIYELIKEKLNIKNSDLNKVVKDYSSRIKNHYLLHSYPSNVVYFTLTLYGFIWNPAVITLSTSDSVSSMFEKAKDNIVILVNSFTGVWNLIDVNQKLPCDLLALAFGKIIQSADIYITNGYNKLYDKDRFAFAFQRSGEAVFTIKASKNKSLSFLVHPDYSYISPDLMAELNSRSETRCVARVLAHKKVLDIIQKKTYYLSPYGTYKSVNDPVFQRVYKWLFDNADKVRWLDSFFAKNASEYNELRNMWDKIHLLPRVLKNQSIVLRHESDS
ncbi:conserved hypothetical protein [Gammaproteobacteria bacterium]